ncbi:MAG: 50S ribosomal protein L9 [Prevotella sp.]
MEIILKEDIIGLGYKNDIVNVKSGYGRNYLIPQGKGVIASPSAKKVLAENLRQQAAKIAAAKAEAEKKAAAFEGLTLEIAAKVSATGVLYGSVNAATVAEELAKKGIEVDRKIITMRDAKKVGDYEAVVHFHKEVEVKVPVKVVAENATEEVKAEETVAATAEPAVEAPVVEEEAPAAE